MKVRKWDKSHPNMGLYSDKSLVCKTCASENIIKRGFNYTKVCVYQAYQCKDCGAYSQSRVRESKQTELK